MRTYKRYKVTQVIRAMLLVLSVQTDVEQHVVLQSYTTSHESVHESSHESSHDVIQRNCNRTVVSMH